MPDAPDSAAAARIATRRSVVEGAEEAEAAEAAGGAEPPPSNAEDAEPLSRRARKLFSEPRPELNRISERVIGAAIDVHRALGPGFLETVYEEALAMELEHRRVAFRRQVVLPVLYRGRAVGESRLDLLVEDELVVELKSVEQITQIHRAQLLSYVRAGAFELGLLINFNVPRLVDGVRRVVSSL